MAVALVRAVVTGLAIAYLLGATFVVAFQFLLANKPHLAPSRMSLMDVAARRIQQGGRPKNLAVLALGLPAEAAAWPVAALRRAQARAFQSRLSNWHYGSAMLLRPLVLIQSASVLGIAGLCWIVTVNGEVVWRPVLMALTVYLLSALIGKHVFFTVRSLQVALRRSLYSPFGVFAAIAATDAVALTLLVSCVRSNFGAAPAALSRAGLIDTAGALFNVPSNLTELTSLGPPALAVAFVGFVYSTALARALVQPSQFHRTDEDWLALADLLINVGDLDRAEQHLARVGDVTVRSLRAKARIQAARGKFGAAVQTVQKSAAITGDDDSGEAAVVALARLWLYTSVELDVVHAFVLFTLESEMPDAIVTEAVQSRAMLGVEDSAGVDGQIESELAALPSTYHLTRAALLMGRGDFSEAATHLGSARPSDPLERILTHAFLVRALIMDSGRSWDQSAEDVSRQLEVHPLASLEPLTKGLRPWQQQVAGIHVIVTEAWLRFLVVLAERGGAEPRSLDAYRAGLVILAEDLIDSPLERQQVESAAQVVIESLTGERLHRLPTRAVEQEPE